jgi:TRAP-type C4-dicarboxylate transport system permease small subunit
MKDSILAVYRNFERVGTIIFMVFLIGITVLQVFGRIMGIHVPWTIEFSRYLLIFITYLGLSEAAKTQEHIGTEFLQSLSSKRIKFSLWLIVQIIFLIFSIYMVLSGIDMVIMHYQSNQMTVSLPYNFSISYISIILPIGFAFTSLHIAGLLFDKLAKKVPR